MALHRKAHMMSVVTARHEQPSVQHCLQNIDGVIQVYINSLALQKSSKLPTGKEAMVVDINITAPVSSGGGLGGEPSPHQAH